jgi:segregation and condensation protein B
MHEPIWNPLVVTSHPLWGEAVARPTHEWAWGIRSTNVPASREVVRRAGTQRSPSLQRMEAALFVADGTLTARKLVQFAALPDVAAIPGMIDQLNQCYEASGTAFRVERLATGYQLMSRPIFARWLDKIHERQARLKLSPPAMETLTIIAYRQPLTRADLEEVRGVQSTEMLKQLMERGLVKVTGEHDSLGRPYLYGTTRLFLESFGVRSLEEMPMADVLRKPANSPAAESIPENEQAA